MIEALMKLHIIAAFDDAVTSLYYVLVTKKVRFPKKW